MRCTRWLIPVLAVLACGDEQGAGRDGAEATTDGDAEADAETTLDADDAWAPGGEARLVGTRIKVAGTWRDGARVSVHEDGGRWTIGIGAGPEIAVEAIEVELVAPMPGARAWLSNGFQSWSQSGVLALSEARPEEGDVEAALALQGDAEVVRDGRALSWWYSWIAGPEGEGQRAQVVGALGGDRLPPSITAWRDGEDVHLLLRSGANGDALAVPVDEAIEVERWLVAPRVGSEALSRALMAFADALPSRRAARAPSAEAGWNSWYDLWSDVDEAAVRANAERVRALLAPFLPVDAPPLRVVVDDGWQLAWGDWYPNDKFPSGLDGLARDLRADGLRMGVWYAPLLVHEDSAIAREHPDWLVGGASFDHLVEGPMRVLDPFRAEAAAHIRSTAARLVGWGCELLKIDFLFAGTFPGARAAPRTGIEAYVRALELIREGAGEDALLLAVGNPVTPALPFVDLWRVGGDIAVEPIGPSFPFIVNQLRSLGARWPFCRRTLCDADPPLLRGQPASQVVFGAWVAALAGGAMFLSDDLRALPEGAGAMLSPAMFGVGLSGAVAVPLDQVPEAPPRTLSSALLDHVRGEMTQVAPWRWRLPSGRQLVFDTASGAAARERWQAIPGTSWQIQLEGELDRTAPAAVYDVDLFDASSGELAALVRAGRVVVCYFSAGSWEDWRPDRDAFPADALGESLGGFADERWLDIRREDVRAALTARLDLAVAKGCDAVDPDNVEGFATETGWPLSAEDQLDFNRWLAGEGHARGLAVGLKNDLAQVAALAPDFDFAVNESCLLWDECALLAPFLAQGKAVFHIEYADEGQSLATVCAEPSRAGFSTVLKRSTSEVDAWREACPL